MKIGMILDNGYNPDVRVYKEAKYLVSKGHSVRIICWDRNQDSSKLTYEKSEGIEIERFNIPSIYGTGKKQLVAYLKFIKECKKYLNQNYFDFLHCHDLTSVIVGFCARKNRTPIVFDMHEYYENTYPPQKSIKHFLIEFLIKRSYAAIYENDVYLDDMYRGVREKLYPLKNYPDSNLIEVLKKSSDDNCFRIGYHGYVRNQVKPFTALFNAVKGMQDVRVDINGIGVDIPILMDELDKYENIYINGPFDGTRELSRLYQNTDVLFCGYNIDDPNMKGTAEIVKYFEAIITGTPMIATKGLAVGDRVEQNGFGLAIDTCDSNEIRKAIMLLKDNKSVWKTFSENELKKSQEYDWNVAVKVLDEIYG